MRPVPGSCSSAYGSVFDANFSARGRVVPSVTAASIHHDDSSEIDLIFGPVVAAQTYRNLLFALVSFPLAILYFVTMMAGLAIGAGTAVIFAGFVILAMVLSIGRLFGRLERELAKAMLGATFDPIPPRPHGLRAALTDGRSWKTVMYLMLRFPLSVITFIVSVLIVAPVAMMSAPVLYTIFPYSVNGIASSQEALLVSLIGCLLFLGIVHAINGLASLSRRLAVAML